MQGFFGAVAAMLGWTAGCAGPGQTGVPVVHVHNISPKGGCAAGLYDQARYPDDDAAQPAPMCGRAGENVITFNNAAGTYAIQTFQTSSQQQDGHQLVGLPLSLRLSRDAHASSKPRFGGEVRRGAGRLQILHLQNSVSLLARSRHSGRRVLSTLHHDAIPSSIETASLFLRHLPLHFHFAIQVQSVAIGWQVYDMQRTPLALGLGCVNSCPCSC